MTNTNANTNTNNTGWEPLHADQTLKGRVLINTTILLCGCRRETWQSERTGEQFEFTDSCSLCR